MSFFEAVASCLGQYGNFSGRASRSEYWWFFLFVILASIILTALLTAFVGENAAAVVSSLFGLAMIVPSLAVGARRLHDMDSSGWWQLLHLLGIGTLVLWAWMLFPGTAKANRYGEPVVVSTQD